MNWMGMGPDIKVLLQKISRLPGLGPRSARRIVLHLLKHRDELFEPLLLSFTNVFNSIKVCPCCRNLDTLVDCCSICTDKSRSRDIICVIENVADLWAIERTSCFRGQYHVLNGLLSSIEGRGPESLFLDQLLERCRKNEVKEIIIALSATVEGQMTDHYIRNFLVDKRIKISSLAHGIPMGGELDYLDEGTLFTAFSARS
ncbi:MAG: recombination mediator RecR [Holosporaceae bacterium]|jgi:recombination protein RecR|nr:recombination mediator RecR [Holosporaceae bacterium]